MDISTLAFSASSPYPTLEGLKPNRQHATAMLFNIGSGNSEMTAVSLYFYYSTLTKASFESISQCFSLINMVEMHHLELFGQAALMLGADPRLWSPNKCRMLYWTPSSMDYNTKLGAMVRNAIAGEEEAIRQYRRQTGWIQDECICGLLNRIVEDEILHLAILHQILDELTCLGQAETSIPVGTCFP